MSLGHGMALQRYEMLRLVNAKKHYQDTHMLLRRLLCLMASLLREVKIRKFECGLVGNNKKNLLRMMTLFADSVKFLLFKVLHLVQMMKLLNCGRWMASFFRKTKVTRASSLGLIVLTLERLFLLVMIAASSFGKMEPVLRLSRCRKQFGV